MRTLRCLGVLGLLLSFGSACGDDETSSTGGGSASSSGTSSPAGSTTSGGPTTASGAGTGGSGDGGSAESSSGQGGTGQGGTGQGGGAGGGLIGGDRPVEVFVPSGYDPGSPAPLVIFLHGYSAAADVPQFYVDYLQIEALAEELGFLFAMPKAPSTPTGRRSGTRPLPAAISTRAAWTTAPTCKA